MHSINYYDEGDEREPSSQEFTSPYITTPNLPNIELKHTRVEDFVLVRMINVRWGWGNFSLIVCLGSEQNI